MGRYRIPKGTTRTEIQVSNSRFITTVGIAATAHDAQAFVRAIRAEMPDASHHVYAFRAGHGKSVTEGMSDDGEPSGTSGPPTMAVVRGADVGDIVLVTTRYFGGTKLGTGGLVSAYTAAAQAAIEKMATEGKVDRRRVRVALPYRTLEVVRRQLGEFECTVEEEDFAAHVTLTLSLPVEQVAGLAAWLANLTGGQVHLEAVDE